MRGHPFMRIEKERVIAALRAVGSRDPDVLRARARAMGRVVRVQEGAGLALAVLGAVASFTRAGPALGVPMVLLGWWVWRLGVRNVAVVEAGFVEVVRSP